MAIVINPISPVAISILGFDIRWYALAYVLAFVVGYFVFIKLMRKHTQLNFTKKQMDDFLTAIILGVILGGRIGYVLFYNLGFFIAHPLEIFAVWHGGMSFHGGLLGVIIATYLYGRKTKTNWLCALDLLSVVAPIGLFFGRIANFINMEVMGRATDVPWGIVFVGNSNIPRHPSPLYEAVSEGILLFLIMYTLYNKTKLKSKPGALAGIMGMSYAVFRSVCELFRAPDVQIGFLTSWGLTMGQLLSSIMFFVGLCIFVFAFRKK
ncbi:MAG: prolipoprotein diacylglyceryl transferase [Alphaproteobacteria bacterium]